MLIEVLIKSGMRGEKRGDVVPRGRQTFIQDFHTKELNMSF